MKLTADELATLNQKLAEVANCMEEHAESDAEKGCASGALHISAFISWLLDDRSDPTALALIDEMLTFVAQHWLQHRAEEVLDKITPHVSVN